MGESLLALPFAFVAVLFASPSVSTPSAITLSSRASAQRDEAPASNAFALPHLGGAKMSPTTGSASHLLRHPPLAVIERTSLRLRVFPTRCGADAD